MDGEEAKKRGLAWLNAQWCGGSVAGEEAKNNNNNNGPWLVAWLKEQWWCGGAVDVEIIWIQIIIIIIMGAWLGLA